MDEHTVADPGFAMHCGGCRHPVNEHAWGRGICQWAQCDCNAVRAPVDPLADQSFDADAVIRWAERNGTPLLDWQRSYLRALAAGKVVMRPRRPGLATLRRAIHGAERERTTDTEQG